MEKHLSFGKSSYSNSINDNYNNKNNTNNNLHKKNNLSLTSNNLQNLPLANIKDLKKELKSKSEIRFKKYYKNYTKETNNEIISNPHRYNKIDSFQKFKEKLKYDELNKKLSNPYKLLKDQSNNSIINYNNKNEDKNKSLSERRGFHTMNEQGFKNITKSINKNLNKKENLMEDLSYIPNYIDKVVENNYDKFFNITKKDMEECKINDIPIKKLLKKPELIKRIKTANTKISSSNFNSRFNNKFSKTNYNSNFLDTGKLSNNNINNETQTNVFSTKSINTSDSDDETKKTTIIKDKKDLKFYELAAYYNSIKDLDLTDEISEGLKNCEILKQFNLEKIGGTKEEIILKEYIQKNKFLKDKDKNKEKETDNNNRRESDIYNLKKCNHKDKEKDKDKDKEKEKEKNKQILLEINNSKNINCVMNIIDPDYSNPISSFRKIKLNKEIYENITKYRNNRLTEKYLDVYNLANEKELRNKQVTYKVNLIDPKFFDGDEFASINPRDLLNKDNNNEIDYNPKLISREQILRQDIDFISVVIGDPKNRPSARSLFSLTIDGDYIYMFGGISGKSIYQIWVCDIKSINRFFLFIFFVNFFCLLMLLIFFYLENYSWKLINIPEDESPNARYGHSACLYKNEIFIYGGCLSNQLEKPKEEIVIYNIGEKNYKKK